mgnify:CR=1 FL=1|jgi:hypothetical protein
MDFDPTAATGERNRSGPRWYSRVAFFVIALLLLFNAIAIFANAAANEERACWAEAEAWNSYYAATNAAGSNGKSAGEYVYGLLRECSAEFGDD